ncbi:amino acid/polyamine transporter I [Chytridium lagenaria]|nr:amino acid/polyamine transporter I [Chytridium lagenaria]
MSSAISSLFTPRSIEALDDEHPDVAGHGHGLDLVLLGIGCIIGAGVFTLTGIVAKTIAGPGVIISYVLAGTVCALSALCYSELAAMIPVSGSAYTYTYATIVPCRSSAVAVGWAYYLEYTLNLVSGGKFLFDPLWSNAPVLWTEATQTFSITGSYFNVPAFLGIILLTIILAFGIRQSSWVVSVFVVVKLVVIVMFLLGGIKFANGANLTPFMPFGFDGAFRGSIIEAKNPQRDMPIGIIGSLTVCTVLYIAVCVMLCSLRPYDLIQVKAPVATAFVDAGGPQWGRYPPRLWCLVWSYLCAYGHPHRSAPYLRAMAFDGLFPSSFAYISPKTGTPVVTTLFSGFFAAVPCCFPLSVPSLPSSLSSAAVIILRIREPERHRPYKIPGGKIGAFLFPSLSMAMIILLLVKGSTKETVIRVFAWMGMGLIVYFSYGFWWSKHRHPQKWPAAPVVRSVEAVETDKKEFV